MYVKFLGQCLGRVCHIYHTPTVTISSSSFLALASVVYVENFHPPLKGSHLLLEVPREVLQGLTISFSRFPSSLPPWFLLPSAPYLWVSHPSPCVQLWTVVPGLLFLNMNNMQVLQVYCSLESSQDITSALQPRWILSSKFWCSARSAEFLLSLLSLELNICPWGLVKTSLLNRAHAALSNPLYSLLFHASALYRLCQLPPCLLTKAQAAVYEPQLGISGQPPTDLQVIVWFLCWRALPRWTTNYLRLESVSKDCTFTALSSRQLAQTVVRWLLTLLL